MQDLIGQTIGDYTILDPIDEGGVADIYRAKSNNSGQLVALKIMKPKSANIENLRFRLKQEFAMMSELDHPHIIDVMDSGTTDQGNPYMVMPFIETGNLAENAGRLSLRQMAIILHQIASALDYAHARNIVHRDIKLENILLDADDNVKLIDFGMAKDSTFTEGKDFITAKGVVLGTPQYLSPEQCLFQPVDARSDVYSLGIVMFVLLTGKFPFDGNPPMIIIPKHISDKPPLITDLNSELSEEIALVIDKALAKAPEDRYQSVGEFSQAFTEATHLDISPKTSMSVQVNLPPVVILGMVAVAVVIVAIVFVILVTSSPT